MADNSLDSDELFALANSDARVLAGVQKVAAKVAARTRKELDRAKIDASVTVRDHPLASGRASVDVVADAPEGSERRVARILRRAGREARGRK